MSNEPYHDPGPFNDGFCVGLVFGFLVAVFAVALFMMLYFA